MNKLEVGMWVRNCYGRIAKIDYIEDNVAYCDNWLCQQYGDYITFININSEEELNEIINASFDIIDLVEVGDYVNGYFVEEKQKKFLIIDSKDNWCWGEGVMPIEEIKSILTHEQFENMEYEVK